MSALLGLFQMMVFCGTLLGIAFMVCLALPQSPFKDFVTKVAGWGLAVICGIYCISPVDVLPEAVLGPFGFFDDIGSLILGIFAARTAHKAGQTAPTSAGKA